MSGARETFAEVALSLLLWKLFRRMFFTLVNRVTNFYWEIWYST